MRRYEQARYHLTRAIAMNPTAEENYRILGIILGQLGHWAEAERLLREGMTLPETGTYTLASLGYVLARSGQRAAAEELLKELTRRGRREYISPVAFATIHLGLGNAAAASTGPSGRMRSGAAGWPISG